MKSVSKLLLIALLAVGLSACDGNDNSVDPGDFIPNGPQNGTMTATVDGNSWSAIQISAINNNGVVAISGSDASLLAAGFGFVSTGPGTYTIGPTSTANANVIDNLATSWSANGTQGSGTITMTTLTAASASGTFSYTAPLTTGTGTPATRVVTNGVFNINFPQ